MVKRRALRLLRQRLKSSPAVALLGARQTGKTTLARSLRSRYYDLEQQEERLRLDLQWDEVVSSRDLVVPTTRRRSIDSATPTATTSSTR